MSNRRDDLFPELTPPSGGLAQLRSRLDADARRGPRLAWLAVPAAAAAVGVGLWLGLPGPSTRWDATLNPALVRYGAPAPGVGVTVPPAQQYKTAVSPGSAEGDVIFYWISSAPVGDAA